MNDATPFDAYAVRTRHGPHVTLQAGVVHLGRHWTTTTRESAKAGSIRSVGWASATVAAGGRHRVVGGPAQVLDPTRPGTFAGAPVAGSLAGGALVRLGLGRLDQLLGYVEAGRRVPDAFRPLGRVLLVIDIRDQLTLEDTLIVDAHGRWAVLGAPLTPERRTRARWVPPRAVDELPDDIAALAATPGGCWLGLTTAAGAVAVPAAWDPGRGTVQAAAVAVRGLRPTLPGPMCVTIHESSQRRPDRKVGVMLRGTGRLVDADGTSAGLQVRAERVTYWRGFATDTVRVRR